MIFSKPKTLHDTVKKLGYINWILGLTGYNQPNGSKCTTFLTHLYTIIVIFGNWLTIWVSCMRIALDSYNNGVTTSAVMVFHIITFVNFFVTLVSPFLCWFQRKAMVKYMQQMSILDDTFRIVFGTEKKYREVDTRFTVKVIVIFLVTFALAIYDFMTQTPKRSGSLIYALSMTMAVHYPVLVILLMDLNFYISLRYLQEKFRRLNRVLRELVQELSGLCNKKTGLQVSQNSEKAMQMYEINAIAAEGFSRRASYLLREIQKAHWELCKLTREVNSAFGLQNLVSMGISFVVIIGMLYIIFGAILIAGFTHVANANLISAAFWSWIYISRVLVISHSCWTTRDEIQRTGDFVYEILSPQVAHEFQKQVELFSVQMIQNSVQLNACGFFTLDYNFVQSMLGSIATYLIILIQMSPTAVSSPGRVASSNFSVSYTT